MVKKHLTAFIDFFHPLFSRWMDIITYRYAVCGSVNTLSGLFIYYIGYHFIFNRTNLELGFYALKPHIAALFISGTFTFCFGFILNKFVVFVESNIKGRVQLFRYFLSFVFNLGLNYCMLKLLVDLLNFEAFISQLVTTAVIIAVSYITQKYFTFKISKPS